MVDSPFQPVSFQSIKSDIKRTIKDPPLSHALTAAVYAHHSQQRDRDCHLTRADAVLLSQLRSGHCFLLGAYRAIMDPSVDPTCAKCGEAPETVDHWLIHCPAHNIQRLNYWGDPGPSLSSLGSDPEKVVLFAQATLRRL